MINALAKKAMGNEKIRFAASQDLPNLLRILVSFKPFVGLPHSKPPVWHTD
jgi:hypothetical protein